MHRVPRQVTIPKKCRDKSERGRAKREGQRPMITSRADEA
jgi:hypothetical protein